MDLQAGLSLRNPDSIELREYQLRAAQGALQKGNTLVVMPTALGKTFVAVLVIARQLFLERQKDGLRKGKYLFLAPTKPLAIQQKARMLETLDITEDETVVLTGEIAPSKREEMWSSKKIFSSTPQTVEHDILTGKVKLSDFNLIVFDEVHHAVKDYAYSFIARQASIQSPSTLLLGLTASPSADKAKVKEVCSNLNIKNVEIVTGDEEGISKYSQELEMERIFVELYPEQKEIAALLRELVSECLKELKSLGFLESASVSAIDKKELLDLRMKLLEALKQSNMNAYRGLSLQAKAMNLVHATDLLESEGAKALKLFLQAMRARDKQTKAVKEIINDFRMKKIEALVDSMLSENRNHPKVEKLKGILQHEAEHGRSTIVFAQFRHSIDSILGEISELPHIKAEQFVGRANDGMSQKKQHEALERFRAGEFNVLVSTSIGEEGLDIPKVDLVIFYESVPSEIRLIQRRGRAGRVRAGRVVMLVTKGTKDEAFLWIARRTEKKMHEQMKTLKRDMEKERGMQTDSSADPHQRRRGDF